ncbi:hypothetical protein AK36_6113 (plasmid) [Burkholderia vietnamiensis LMG 10929]|nr:hypothetical protein AK36_6113 [Burkholderia vietnamiensis LMG 10929]
MSIFADVREQTIHVFRLPWNPRRNVKTRRARAPHGRMPNFAQENVQNDYSRHRLVFRASRAQRTSCVAARSVGAQRQRRNYRLDRGFWPGASRQGANAFPLAGGFVAGSLPASLAANKAGTGVGCKTRWPRIRTGRLNLDEGWGCLAARRERRYNR